MIFALRRCGSRAVAHHGSVHFSVGPTPGGTASAGHAGFVAGRYRNGAYSDAWTDVSRCADGTFTGYAAACTCGWRGPLQPATAVGQVRSSRDWQALHLAAVIGAVGQPGADDYHAPPCGATAGSGRLLPAVSAS